MEKNILNINKKSSTAFKKNRKYGKNNFYKLKNWKKKKAKKNYFREIHAKKVHSYINQQQNWQRQKGPQQNERRAKKMCFLLAYWACSAFSGDGFKIKINFKHKTNTVIYENHGWLIDASQTLLQDRVMQKLSEVVMHQYNYRQIKIL